MFAELDRCVLPLAAQDKLADVKENSALAERQKFIIANCLSENFAKETTAQEIEQGLNMSKRNAARIVYNHFGKTVSDLVLEHRMKTATTWIKNSDEPLSVIAERVGYKTYVAFFTAFKKYYGASPTDYREEV